MGYSPWGPEELGMTERLHLLTLNQGSNLCPLSGNRGVPTRDQGSPSGFILNVILQRKMTMRYHLNACQNDCHQKDRK